MTEQLPETDAPEPQQTDAPEEAKKPPQTRNNFAELQRTKDREVAEANRGANAARSAQAEAETKLADLETLYREAREKSNFTDDDEAYVKRRNDLERDLATRQNQTNAHERTLTIKYLAAEYGIPADDLDSYDNPKDMEIAALKYSRTSAAAAAPADEEDTTPEEPEETPVRSQFDLGTGSGATKSIADMTDAEFDAYDRSQKAISRRQTRR